MIKPKKIKELEHLARDMVGDGKTPNLYFVSNQGVIVTVTRDFEKAFNEWHSMSIQFPKFECALEDRLWGTICSVEPRADGTSRETELVIWDDSNSFLRKYKK